MVWSQQKLTEGVSEALIANLDSLSMSLLPEEVDKIGEDVFQELLEDLRSKIEE